MPELFESTWIKSLELPNRSVRSATWAGVGDKKGHVTDLAVEFYRELGRGGIGLIIAGYQYVLPNGIQLTYQVGNYDDSQVEGLSRLVKAVHEEGGKIVPQIVHTGERANPANFPEPGWDVWTPSGIAVPGSDVTLVEVDQGQILQLVEAYAQAAARAQRAGFDGVQLHGAHGYGINQFLSPAVNQRGDGYGGSVGNRYRFLGEVMEAVRGAVGEDFPVMIKLSGNDFCEGGLEPGESLEIARRLADDGIDAIEVSGGGPNSPANQGPARTKISKPEREGYFADLAAAVKENVSVPVMAVGGIRSYSTVTDILAAGKADYVALSRPFIREPGLINRWKSGDTEKATCISCNGCFETGVQGLGISCKVDRKRKEKE